MSLSEHKKAFEVAAWEIWCEGYGDGLAEAAAQYSGGIPRQEPSPQAIIVWRFHEAPKAFRDLSRNGGDEDWLALLPGDDVPIWMTEGGPFGCCSVDEHRLTGGRLVVIGCHA
jgi:hypothetical protein